MNKSYEISPETDISFVSSGRPSTDCMFPAFSESLESGPRLSISSDVDYRRSSYSGNKFIDMSSSQCEVSSSSIESGNSWSSQYMVRHYSSIVNLEAPTTSFGACLQI